MSRELFGLYYGVVQKDEDPDKLDRFRVKLDCDGTVTQFAHVLMPMGWLTLPDAKTDKVDGDKVVVAFVGGKPEHPVILGGVWNDAKRPPEVNEDGKNNFRGYRSRPRDGSRTGHRLIFDDSDKPKVVFADTTRTNAVGIGNFAKAGAGENACGVFRPMESSSGGVAISSTEGTLEITCKGTLKVTAENIKMNGDEKLEAVASKIGVKGMDVKITSSQQLNADLTTNFV